MFSFKQYLNEVRKLIIRPQDMERRSLVRDVSNQKQVDFDDPAYTHQFKRATKDSEQWPPKPAAKYKADQIRWAVSTGKQAQHLAKES